MSTSSSPPTSVFRFLQFSTILIGIIGIRCPLELDDSTVLAAQTSTVGSRFQQSFPNNQKWFSIRSGWLDGSRSQTRTALSCVQSFRNKQNWSYIESGRFYGSPNLVSKILFSEILSETRKEKPALVQSLSVLRFSLLITKSVASCFQRSYSKQSESLLVHNWLVLLLSLLKSKLLKLCLSNRNKFSFRTGWFYFSLPKYKLFNSCLTNQNRFSFRKAWLRGRPWPIRHEKRVPQANVSDRPQAKKNRRSKNPGMPDTIIMSEFKSVPQTPQCMKDNAFASPEIISPLSRKIGDGVVIGVTYFQSFS